MFKTLRNTIYGGGIGAVTGFSLSVLVYTNAFPILLFLVLGLLIGYIHP
ncbi:hypothetical protein OAT84_00290 [Gammaproteobacteria bacterium]|nr:hypothetical protein [Gammaproteobacteria bacterium]